MGKDRGRDLSIIKVHSSHAFFFSSTSPVVSNPQKSFDSQRSGKGNCRHSTPCPCNLPSIQYLHQTKLQSLTVRHALISQSTPSFIFKYCWSTPNQTLVTTCPLPFFLHQTHILSRAPVREVDRLDLDEEVVLHVVGIGQHLENCTLGRIISNQFVIASALLGYCSLQ